MELADLARWTPVRLDFSGPAPTVDWADLSAERFAEPFFDQTVVRWASGPLARPVVRTGLEALVAFDSQPSLEPAGMIFHLSRCESTLVSRLLGTLPGVVVVAEPGPLNALLGLDPGRVGEAELVRVVRLLVRALGRCRHGDERRLVLKCTSWNIRRRPIVAAAFPETPWIWVQRDPARVVASLLAKPPGWLGLQAAPEWAARRFGLDPAAVPAMAGAESRPAPWARCWRRPRPIRRSASASTMPTCPPPFGSVWLPISGSRPMLRQSNAWLKSLGSTRRIQQPGFLPVMSRSAAR
jgi:hypothetical protein